MQRILIHLYYSYEFVYWHRSFIRIEYDVFTLSVLLYIIEQLYGNEAHLSAEKEKKNPYPWISETHENCWWPECPETSTPVW